MAKYLVRYGAMRLLGVFDAPGEDNYQRGLRVIARTDRGLEAGEVLCPASAEAVAGLKDLHEGQILRKMSPDDAREIARIDQRRSEQLAVCQASIDKIGLQMQLVDIEQVFGGERIVVYYLAEGRVDFRELVRLLAGEFQTRIEMRQIGVRDEAKLMADFGDCGKEVCCNSHLIQMPPVSMKMAKMQKATLDPTKISGRCGRLKCCLRYEYDVYEQLQKELPPIGSKVTTPDGPARVVGHEILVGHVLVETADRVRKLVDAADVVRAEAELPAQPANDDASDADDAENGSP